MNQSWNFVYLNRELFVLLCFESCNEQNFLFLWLRLQFGSKSGQPLGSVKPAVVYGHWCGQLMWLCSSPAQSLGGFPSCLPVRSFQRTYGREVHDGPHSNLLWAGRMPERWTHSLIKVSGEKMTWEKSVIKRQASIQGETWRLRSVDLPILCVCLCGWAVPLMSSQCCQTKKSVIWLLMQLGFSRKVTPYLRYESAPPPLLHPPVPLSCRFLMQWVLISYQFPGDESAVTSHTLLWGVFHKRTVKSSWLCLLITPQFYFIKIGPWNVKLCGLSSYLREHESSWNKSDRWLPERSTQLQSVKLLWRARGPAGERASLLTKDSNS